MSREFFPPWPAEWQYRSMPQAPWLTEIVTDGRLPDKTTGYPFGKDSILNLYRSFDRKTLRAALHCLAGQRHVFISRSVLALG